MHAFKSFANNANYPTFVTCMIIFIKNNARTAQFGDIRQTG